MIRRYETEDYAMIESWFNKHGKTIDPRDLSPIGFIRNEAAAGFLYETESRVCIIDNIVTNPDVSMFERYNGVREVVKKLLEIVRFKKYRVWAITHNRSISRIAQSFGFKSQGWYEILHKGD